MRVRLRPPGGLVHRTLWASGAVAVLVCSSLALLLLAMSASRRSMDRQSHSKDVAIAIVDLEKATADLDSALHAYVATRDKRFLKPWRTARAEVATAEQHLRSLVAGNPSELLQVEALQTSITSYVSDYALPLMHIARIDPRTATSAIAQLENKRRSDQIRADLRGLLSVENRRAADRRQATRAQSHRAEILGLTSLGLSAALLVLFGAYLARAIAQPIRNAAVAAGEVAAGDFDVRLPETGPGEIADLARAFNSMTRDLAENRRELLEQNTRLHEAERHKTELISMVSHEVRTPLSSLLGFTDLLLRGDLDEPVRRRYLEIIHQESRRLAALTRDFLDVRLLEEGALDLALERIDVAQIVEEQARMLLAASATHELVLDVPDEPIWVDGDRDRLSQVVGNLVVNAVKYSPDGGPVVVRATNTAGVALIEVSDHGLGISLDDQPLIFTKFYRGRAAASGIPGTGLGLAIARQLVQAHGGDISFESRIGTGSTFRVELPTR